MGSTDIDVHFDGTSLNNVKCEKLLGVSVDNHLTWKPHIDSLASSLSKCIGLFRRIRTYLPISARILYYKTFFQPRIDYCSIVWGSSCHITRIYKLQKIILRLIYDKPKLSPSAPLFEQASILPIEYRVMFRSLIMVYKALNGLLPSYITNMFKYIANVTKRSTRSSSNGNLWVPNYKLTITRSSFSYNGAVIYNTLPQDIKLSESLRAFKKNLFKYLIDMYIIST